MRKHKPACNQLEWIAFFEAGGTPEVFVNVSNCRARIVVLRDGNYVDVTGEIPNGEKLAEEAVYAFGGAINISGWYPPTKEIIEALKRSIAGEETTQPGK